MRRGAHRLREEQTKPRLSGERSYTSDYFNKMRAYAETTGLPWFILSAEHGLVSPDEWLEPYERYLPATAHATTAGPGDRMSPYSSSRQWARSADLLSMFTPVPPTSKPSRNALRASGAQVTDQLKGFSFGRRLSWYLQHRGADAASGAAVVRCSAIDGRR